MRKVIATTFVSLDGVMQGPGSPDEDTSGSFDLGGWTVPYWDEATTALTEDIYVLPYDLLLGRRTYNIFAAYWPHVEKDPKKPGYEEGNARIGKQFDAVTKYVATHSPESLTWQRSKWLGQNVVPALEKLREDDGPPLLVVGSSALFQTLMANGLVDQLRLLVFPVVLGKGKRLFADESRSSAFEVTHSTTTPSGVIGVTYTAAGKIETGTFVPAETRGRRGDQPHA
jgi:dihydrofolate reductase